jgi:hypothetical protein
MQQQFVHSPTRFQQVSRILTLIGTPNNYDQYQSIRALIVLDEVLVEVSSESSIWPSEFARMLREASIKLWDPILRDLEHDAQAVAVKFLIIGLIDVVGKPLMMAYPLWLICEQALLLVQSVKVPNTQPGHENETTVTVTSLLRGINSSMIVKVVKALLLLFLVQRFIVILELLKGAGHACIAIGVGLYAVTLQSSTMKKFAIVLAQNLTKLNSFTEQFGAAEQSLYNTLGINANPGPNPGTAGVSIGASASNSVNASLNYSTTGAGSSTNQHVRNQSGSDGVVNASEYLNNSGRSSSQRGNLEIEPQQRVEIISESRQNTSVGGIGIDSVGNGLYSNPGSVRIPIAQAVGSSSSSSSNSGQHSRHFTDNIPIAVAFAVPASGQVTANGESDDSSPSAPSIEHLYSDDVTTNGATGDNGVRRRKF